MYCVCVSVYICVCFSRAPPLCESQCLLPLSVCLSLTLSISLCPAPDPYVWLWLQMNGTMFLLAARMSCSTGQREAKKTSVL